MQSTMSPALLLLLLAAPVVAYRQQVRVEASQAPEQREEGKACGASSALCLCTSDPVKALPLFDGTREYGSPKKIEFHISGVGLEALQAANGGEMPLSCEELPQLEVNKVFKQPCDCNSPKKKVKHWGAPDAEDAETVQQCVAIGAALCIEARPELLKCRNAEGETKLVVKPSEDAQYRRPGSGIVACEPYVMRRPGRRVWCEWEPRLPADMGESPDKVFKAACKAAIPSKGWTNAFQFNAPTTSHPFYACGYNTKYEKCLNRLNSEHIAAGPWLVPLGN